MTSRASVVPVVIETTHKGDRVFDIYSRLLRDRIIILGTPIDAAVANAIVAQLLFLESEDRGRNIQMYINSPGGAVTAGLAIYDTIQFIKSPVETICMGMAASMAAVLLAAGTKGKRAILPNAEVMIHQPLGGVKGQATDIEIHTRHILSTKERLNRILSSHTGQPIEKVSVDTDRDYYLTAEEAAQYGIVDFVCTRSQVE